MTNEERGYRVEAGGRVGSAGLSGECGPSRP